MSSGCAQLARSPARSVGRSVGVLSATVGYTPTRSWRRFPVFGFGKLFRRAPRSSTHARIQSRVTALGEICRGGPASGMGRWGRGKVTTLIFHPSQAAFGIGNFFEPDAASASASASASFRPLQHVLPVKSPRAAYSSTISRRGTIDAHFHARSRSSRFSSIRNRIECADAKSFIVVVVCAFDRR